MNRTLIGMALAFACLARASAAAAPANDHFVNALPLTGTNATVRATNDGATREVGEPNHSGNPGGKSVWWAWTAPGSGSVVVETTGSTFDTLLASYTGASFATMNLVTSNDDSGSQQTSKTAFNVAAGVTYRIAVDGFSGASGEIQLAVHYRDVPLARPINDNFEDRTVLAGPFVGAAGANFLAGKEPEEPNHAGDPGGASVWWTWTAAATGRVQIDTLGSSFDTLLAIYTGAVLTNLSRVASSDDVSTNQTASTVTFEATAGSAYQIAIDGFNGESGDVQLNIAMGELFQLAAPVQLTNNRWRLTLTSAPGIPCALEASTNLFAWARLAVLTNTTGLFEFTDSPAQSLPRRFYRARRIDD